LFVGPVPFIPGNHGLLVGCLQGRLGLTPFDGQVVGQLSITALCSTQLQGPQQQAISFTNSLGDARIVEIGLLFRSFGKTGTQSVANAKPRIPLDLDRSLWKIFDAF
jgi:hypothetical protein